ncbi:MAG: YtxH domain-containing protein [Gemmatimonadales bacterium]
MKKDAERDRLPDLDAQSGGHVGLAGAIALAAVVGLGVGLLAAPQAGERTRKALKDRLAGLGEDIEDGLEEFEERSRPARKMLRKRAAYLRDRGGKAWEEIEDRLEHLEGRNDNHSTGLFGILTFAAGLAATYFVTSEQAAPTREKVRDAASHLRERATDRWDRFQERRHTNGGASEGGTQAESTTGNIGTGGTAEKKEL